MIDNAYQFVIFNIQKSHFTLQECHHILALGEKTYMGVNWNKILRADSSMVTASHKTVPSRPGLPVGGSL